MIKQSFLYEKTGIKKSEGLAALFIYKGKIHASNKTLYLFENKEIHTRGEIPG